MSVVPPSHTPIVILVDDDPIDLELNALSIRRSGYNVDIHSFSIAHKALEFIRICHVNNQIPALMITDLQMPVMSGLELIQFMETSGLKTFPAIVMSASSLFEDVFRAKQVGADGCYEKPIDLSESLNLFSGILQNYVFRAQDVQRASAA